MAEPIVDFPEFLTFGGIQGHDTLYEVVSRRRLDTRQVLPFFDHGGVRHVGVLRRGRTSRALRGQGSTLGFEPIGIDFGGVDETGDILEYGRAIFTEHARVTLDDAALKLPSPSLARSIGYLTELALPLAVPIVPPTSRTLDVTWDGIAHQIVFSPVADLRAQLRDTAHDELLASMLGLLAPLPSRNFESQPGAAAFIERNRAHVRDAAALLAALHAEGTLGLSRAGDLRGRDLRFLRAFRHEGIEVVTPGTGASLAVLPFVVHQGEPWFILWFEQRPAALERTARLPIFDSPIHPWFLNATARFLDASEQAACTTDAGLTEVAARVLSSLSRSLTIEEAVDLGVAEPAPSCSSERRRRLACRLAPDVDLPAGAVLVRASELCRAVGEGAVRDPVVVATLCDLGFDPFSAVRAGNPADRRAFVDTMTRGSVVLRRLRKYSSIEAEQLNAPTYARLMIRLQAEHGVRIAYPSVEQDRGFFKAAFRVFMADDRGGDMRKQGLHWSHDAFHFALGNFTPPVTMGALREFYLSDQEKLPPLEPEGPAWESFARALKSAEDEATFFSFWTLFDEHPPLARYVEKLTFHAALVALGVLGREASRAVFDAVTTRVELPTVVSEHPAYAAREDIRSLFTYMLGFRDYHLKDIRTAWRVASRDPYRAILVRLGLYETDEDRYVANVRAYQARLDATPPGFDALSAAAADVRVDLALRAFDVTKALRLSRSHTDDRRRTMDEADAFVERLSGLGARLASVAARILDAELSPRNERILAELHDLSREVDAVHQAIWNATLRVLPAEVVAEERARTLPR